MAQVELYNLKKDIVGKFELPEEIFNTDVNQAVLYEVVKNQLANRRRGTHSTKTKAEVRGGGKKPWKQKHTGRARQGSIRSVQWVGGGIAFGPKPRDYSYNLPRKMKKKALCSALSYHFKNHSLFVLDSMSFDAPKTSAVVNFLKNFNAESALIVDVKDNRNLMLGSRNLPKVKFVPEAGVNVYDLLNYKNLFLSPRAVEFIQKMVNYGNNR